MTEHLCKTSASQVDAHYVKLIHAHPSAKSDPSPPTLILLHTIILGMGKKRNSVLFEDIVTHRLWEQAMRFSITDYALCPRSGEIKIKKIRIKT